jgi:hypothetical protein
MRKLLAAILAAVIGLAVAGALGLLAGQAPVFHWEMAGLFVAGDAAVAGAIAGAVGAASGRWGIGAGVGSLLGGATFILLSLGEQHPPLALTFWGTVAVAVAAGAAGALGGVIGRGTSRAPTAGA